VCLIALGRATKKPLLGVPLALAAGFGTLNVFGMALTDFYLALALFHLTVGIATVALLRRARWLGALTLGLALALGMLT
jgi:hypothetical protein